MSQALEYIKEKGLLDEYETWLSGEIDDTCCDECSKEITSGDGYFYNGGDHYCSEDCLFKHEDKEQWSKDAPNNEQYWSIWEEQ